MKPPSLSLLKVESCRIIQASLLALSIFSILTTYEPNLLDSVTTHTNLHDTVRGLLGCIITFLIPYYCLNFPNDLLAKRHKIALDELRLAKSLIEAFSEKGMLRTGHETICETESSFRLHKYSEYTLIAWHSVVFVFTLCLSLKALYLSFSQTIQVLSLLF